MSTITPVQHFLLDFEAEISSPETIEAERDNILKLNTFNEILDYYGEYRGWIRDEDLKYSLIKLAVRISRYFPNV